MLQSVCVFLQIAPTGNMTQEQSDEASKVFHTLRGAITGDEPDENPYFAYSATLRIFGDQLDLDDISHCLQLIPTNAHRKGEQRSPKARPYDHDMWSYSPALSEEQPLDAHIDALWADIKPATDYLRALKQLATVDVFLGYRSNSDHAGVTLPPSSLALFITLDIPFGLSIIIT
jgi:Domain of unknown function (DUF4279)